MAFSLTERFGKKNAQRFLNRDLMEEREFIPKKVYTEVVDNHIYKTVDNGVIQFSKSALDSHGTDVARNLAQLKLKIPKLPYAFYRRMINFYHLVVLKHRTEACVLYYWNKDNVEIPSHLVEENKDGLFIEGQHIMLIPEQYNSSGLSQFVRPAGFNREEEIPEMIQWLEHNTECIMETHSHCDFSNFWSATDNSNESGRQLRLYSVYGYNQRHNPPHSFRVGF